MSQEIYWRQGADRVKTLELEHRRRVASQEAHRDVTQNNFYVFSGTRNILRAFI